MTNELTLTAVLSAEDIDINLLYNMATDAIEIERVRLEIFESIADAPQYCQSLKKISQYQRLLSLIRIDALSSYNGMTRQQSVN